MKTETLINALKILALDIQSDDGVACSIVARASYEIADLVKQRDELIEALDYTASLIEESGVRAETARQAIAKAKGEL